MHAVMAAETPYQQKKAAAKLSPMERQKWLHCYAVPVMSTALEAKFKIPEFEAALMATEDEVLIEASPYDR